MSITSKLFIWKDEHEKMLLREVITTEPYQFKSGTKERGSAWTDIAERLVSLGLRVTQRSVREKFDHLMKAFMKKESEEKAQSGVDVEYGEVEQCLQDIKERMAEFEELREGEERKEKKDKAAAQEMRKRATEKLSETKKRKASSEDSDVDDNISPEKKRKSTSMVDVVKETMEFKRKQQESNDEIRKRELDLRAAEMQQQQRFQQSLLQQQQQCQQQQQALNMSMMAALSELLKVINKK